MTPGTGGIDDQMLAKEIARILIALHGRQGMLDHYFALRSTCNKSLWKKVLTLLIEERG